MKENGKDTNKQHIKAFCFMGLLLFILSISNRVFGYYYAINDDITMQGVASGAVSGIPDGHIVFIRYILGIVLAGLYRSFPGYDWYGLALLFLMILCILIVSNRVIALSDRNSSDRILKISIVILTYILLFVYSFIFFQFTVVAGIISATAVFVISSTNRERIVYDYSVMLVLLLLSYIIRVNVFNMTLPLVGSASLIKCYELLRTNADYAGMRREESRRSYRSLLFRMAMVSLAGVIMYSCVYFSHSKAYAYEPWKEYSDYKHARSLIMDYYGWPEYSDNEDFWEKEGVSEEEYDCRYMYALVRDFSPEKIIRIGEYAEETYHDAGTIESHLKDMGLLVRKSLRFGSVRSLLALTILALFISLLTMHRDKYVVLYLIGGGIIEASILVFLLLRGRFPERIAIIILFHCIFYILGIWLSRPEEKSGRHRIAFMTITIISGLIISVFVGKDTFEKINEYRQDMIQYSEFNEYLQSNNDKLYVVPTNTISTVKQFTIKDKSSPGNTIGTRGWSVYSPWNEKKYKEWGIDSEEYVLLDPAVYILTSDMENMDLLEKYLDSEGIGEIEYNIIDSFRLTNGKEIFSIKFTVQQ